MQSSILLPENDTDKYLETVTSIENIRDHLIESNEIFLQLTGLILGACTTSIHRLIENSNKAVGDLRYLFRSLKEYEKFPFESNYKKYGKYFDFVCVDNPDIFLDKFSKYDANIIMNMLGFFAWEAVKSKRKEAIKLVSQLEKNDRAKRVVMVDDPDFINDLTYNEKHYRGIMKRLQELANVDLSKTKDGNPDSIFRCDFNHADVRCFFQSCIEGFTMGSMVDGKFVFLQGIRYMRFMLIVLFKSLYGSDFFLRYEKNNFITIEPLKKIGTYTAYGLIQMCTLYAYMVEELEKRETFFGVDEQKPGVHKAKQEIQLESLKKLKDIVLAVLPKAIPEVHVKDAINYFYGIFSKDPVLGQTDLENFLQHPLPFSSDLLANSRCDAIREGALNLVIEKIKERRKNGIAVHDEMRYFLSSDFVFDMRIFVQKWTTHFDNSDIGYVSEIMQAWKHVWDNTVNQTKFFTVFGDKSEFGFLTTMSLTTLFRYDLSALDEMMMSELERVLMIALVHAHIKDETRVDWTPDTINLLNSYLSFIAATLTFGAIREFVDLPPNIPNLCKILNYRSVRQPVFPYRKEPITPIEYNHYIQPQSISKPIIRNALATANVTKDDEVGVIVRYLGDAILNNCINAEYAIFALLDVSRQYSRSDPFTKLTRYVLRKVGDRWSDFFERFDHFEFNEVYAPMEMDSEPTEDKKATKTKRIEGIERNLEMFVYISLLQRIRINVEVIKDINSKFGKQILSWNETIKDAPVKRGWIIPDSGNVVSSVFEDIDNAMSIFDSVIVNTRNKDDWFNRHKDLIIDTNTKEPEIEKGPSWNVGDMDPRQELGQDDL